MKRLHLHVNVPTGIRLESSFTFGQATTCGEHASIGAMAQAAAPACC